MGSFLNVLIYRLPLGISLVNPKRSVCPNCDHQITWYENIPVISYIFLKGKCSSCKIDISPTYPMVEIISGLVTFLLFVKFDIGYQFVLYSLLFYVLIVLSFIDLKYKAVPDYLLILIIVLSLFIPETSFSTLLIFAGGAFFLEFFVSFYIQNIKSKILKDPSLEDQKALGEGDIPIFASIGAVLGIKLGISALFLSSIFAIIPAIINMKLKKDMETPFIPFLSLGFFVTLIFDQFMLDFLESISI